jgi:hypothetical protein
MNKTTEAAVRLNIKVISSADDIGVLEHQYFGAFAPLVKLMNKVTVAASASSTRYFHATRAVLREDLIRVILVIIIQSRTFCLLVCCLKS